MVSFINSSALLGLAAAILAGPRLVAAAAIPDIETVYVTNVVVNTVVVTAGVTETVAAPTSTSTTEAQTTPTTTSTSAELAIENVQQNQVATAWTSAWTSTIYFGAETSSEASSAESTAAATATSYEAASSASIDSDIDTDWALDILDAHNQKRALHGVPALTWNDTLYQYAKDYANSAYQCDGKLVHSGGPYGENLAAGTNMNATSAADCWYDEISTYDFTNPGDSTGETGHFTAMVWKSTTQVGCAYIDCDNVWGQYVICSYHSAGNIVGDDYKYYLENVLPLA